MNNKQAFNVTTIKTPTQDDRYLSVKSVSEMYDIKQDTIRKWIAKGHIAKHNIRGLVRVKLSEFESLVIRKPSRVEMTKKILKVV